ncbi:PREDICTED: putative transcription elongation factor SPT5 homolog 1 [Camelina sativa]|uniref:Transcription elongation factor SPT5 homolog 1 n=1 Tax=Camelina sativa TaxID=90675 RepID=A0ABM0TCY4_CAMSA|nr:PREDICTED: putative transcription elongation factor SPT5 homolog 1 [Camelina sativa]
MPRSRDEDDDVDEDYEGLDLEEDEEEEEEEERGRGGGGGGSRRKRGRSSFIDDYAEEDSQEEDDDDDEDYGSRGGKGGAAASKRKKPSASIFLDREAHQVDDEDEEEEEDGEDDFIVDAGTDLPDERGDRRYERRFLSRDENDEDVEDLERRIQERFSRHHEEYDEEATDVEQQALLPSVRDPKLWMVKCAIGREREVAVCLMQKFIDRGADLQIRSVVALDHLKNYIYVEADKEAHVKEAIKGMRNIYANQKILLVPIREMTDVLSVESKAIDISRDTWVRMKIGTYKGDLAKDPLAVNEKELCKYFEPGNHVKVVSGTHEGATGMVVKVDQHVLIILSDTTKEHVRVFADHVVESSEVTTGVTKIGDYELHDLVLLDNLSFGVIIRLENEAFQVLKGVPDRPEVALVKLREIKCKIEKKFNVQDRYKNVIAVKDDVRVIEGPSKGKQGPVKHIYKGVLFIYDRHHLEHAGFICAKCTSCIVVGGSRSGANRNGGDSFPRYGNFKAPAPVPSSPGRFQRGRGGYNSGGRHRGGRGGGDNSLLGTTVKIRLGPFKGYRGPVVEVKGNLVRVELEMKIVTVDRNAISDNVATTPFRDTSRYSMGSETPMHPSRTPLHPYMTPMRDSGATPIHDGMRTPMRDRAWNPYTPMSPSRDSWEDGNPGSWGTSPQYQPGSPPSRAYEAPTPGSGWASTPGGSYSDAGTPRDHGSAYANAPSPYLPSTPGQPMTPSSASYLPGTPGGQPMTPGTGLDVMSPVIGGDAEAWFMPDILVDIHKAGEDSDVGVIRDVSDGTCKVSLGSSGEGDTIMALPSELEIVPPRKSDRVKIVGGQFRGSTGKLIGIDGSDGIVKIDDNLDVKILDLAILAKFVQP